MTRRRTSTVERSITVLAAPGHQGTIKFVQGKDAEYTTERATTDAKRIVAALLAILPTSAFLALAWMMAERARVIEAELQQRKVSQL